MGGLVFPGVIADVVWLEGMGFDGGVDIVDSEGLLRGEGQLARGRVNWGRWRPADG